MATYFNEANSDTDALQTLILMNPNYNNSNSNSSSSFVFLNSSMSPATQSMLPKTTTEHTHHLVGIPLTHNHHHELISPSPGPQYNQWSQIETSTVARETPRAQHGLSLSLSNPQQNPKLLPLTQSAISPSGSKEDITGTPSPASVISNSPVSGMRSVLMSSKYLKATQQLLDEVVNVGSNTPTTDSTKKKDNKITKTSADTPPVATAGEVSTEISTAEKQEIQMKKGKLISILNELEQRYRQYNHRMQIVIVSFEQAAGEGSAKAYTALALRTISRQFRCMKDAILTQMKAVNKALGEKDIGGGSRLKFVDHHLRQQCALHQLGMVQHNAWRPQRGLPERSVSVLRAWLFEHFLHPYPKDSDKLMLAKQTGLTRSQVSNWFINARVRLWKPMVEEMYNEEFKEQENEGLADKMGNNGEASTSKSPTEENLNMSFKNASQEIYQNAASKTDSISPRRLRSQQTAGFSLIGSSELEGITQMSPKRQRINDQMLHHRQNPTSSFQSSMEMNSNNASNEHVLVKLRIESQPRDDYSLMAAGPANFIGGFGSYPMEEIRFDTNQYTQPMFSGNGVSLTLGLTDTHHQSFLPNQSSAEWTLARQLNSVP